VDEPLPAATGVDNKAARKSAAAGLDSNHPICGYDDIQGRHTASHDYPALDRFGNQHFLEPATVDEIAPPWATVVGAIRLEC
jgi:hypothetical protein